MTEIVRVIDQARVPIEISPTVNGALRFDDVLGCSNFVTLRVDIPTGIGHLVATPGVRQRKRVPVRQTDCRKH